MTARRAEGEEEDLYEQENPRGFPDGPTGEAKDLGSIPGLGRSPGERNGKALQYSGLDNSMDRGAWQAAVHGVTKSQTWLSKRKSKSHKGKGKGYEGTGEMRFVKVAQKGTLRSRTRRRIWDEMLRNYCVVAWGVKAKVTQSCPTLCDPIQSMAFSRPE